MRTKAAPLAFKTNGTYRYLCVFNMLRIKNCRINKAVRSSFESALKVSNTLAILLIHIIKQPIYLSKTCCSHVGKVISSRLKYTYC